MQVKLKEHSFKLLVERTQLKELTSHEMLLIMFQNLSALAKFLTDENDKNKAKELHWGEQ